jgi:hypothetical protein
MHRIDKDILKRIIKEEIKKAIIEEGQNEYQNYMFFQNLQTIKRMVEKMLQLNPQEVDALLSDGHGWAVDHISTAADDVGEVGTWLCNEVGQPSNNMMNENNENNNWETVYTWAKLFSTDNGNFLSKNNITSGVWLKKAIESGKITLQDIDNVTRESDSVKFSELPMVKTLTKNTISESESWKKSGFKSEEEYKKFLDTKMKDMMSKITSDPKLLNVFKRLKDK